MIVCGGVVGLCLMLGGMRHGHQELKRQGTSAYLAMLAALAVLALVPAELHPVGGDAAYSGIQLGFVSVLAVLLYGSFVLAQTERHKEDFVEELIEARERPHLGDTPGVWGNAILLLAGLVGVVLLAEDIAAGIEGSLVTLQVQHADAIVGAFIATLVLLPELSAIRASLKNDLSAA